MSTIAGGAVPIEGIPLRIIAPIGGGAFVRGGCLLSPVMLLVYLVYWGVVLTIMTVVLIAMGVYYAGWGTCLGIRWLYRRHDDDTTDRPAKHSDRR